MAQYANPQQFGAPMGEDGQYMQQVHKYKYTDKNTLIQIHKYINTNTTTIHPG